jgi:hypothetical protein
MLSATVELVSTDSVALFWPCWLMNFLPRPPFGTWQPHADVARAHRELRVASPEFVLFQLLSSQYIFVQFKQFFHLIIICCSGGQALQAITIASAARARKHAALRRSHESEGVL